jgi:hemerythrin superfamily protein
MSIVDKVIAAVTPPESDEARAAARQKATAAAEPGDWLSQILDHHRGLEQAFAMVKSASDPASRTAAFKQLALRLNGHSLAEETVIYPALAEDGEKAHAAAGYEEQSMVKIQMAMLEKLDPMSQDYIDKLEHIQGAVAHHVYAEEGNWFLDLKEKASASDQAMMTRRYAEEYERYMGAGQPA